MGLIQRKIYLDSQTDQLVQEHQRTGGFGGKGLSAAIRNIISEWAELRERRYVLTEAGRQALAEADGEVRKE